ncbi:MAG: 1-(5-phosphoribosyl)-5-[(5-phosphoribosylamino)methylideneamino]imidazole-4-carboxamide isomerase [Gammaproteobacteria bacterium]|nr:1-(5-phosphoribosyl)-5-[(5-phosphoribosylamino)methylideneamino]imidazole-4-carboxamide isomerase [Gammaproteobacteria bacterium]
MNLIPAIDLLDGEVVRLLEGDFEARTRYGKAPTAIADAYIDAGAKQLHLVDLNAARGDADSNQALIAKLVRHCTVPVQVGGGVRDEDRLSELLDVGAARVVVGSLAVNEPERVKRWLAIYGPEKIVLALDVRIDASGEPRLMTQGWLETQGESLWPLLAFYVEAGLQHLLCTDIALDGSLKGPNVELYADIVARFPALALQASGGVSSLDDLRALRERKVPAAILGKALLEGRFSVEEALAVSS